MSTKQRQPPSNCLLVSLLVDVVAMLSLGSWLSKCSPVFEYSRCFSLLYCFHAFHAYFISTLLEVTTGYTYSWQNLIHQGMARSSVMGSERERSTICRDAATHIMPTYDTKYFEEHWMLGILLLSCPIGVAGSCVVEGTEQEQSWNGSVLVKVRDFSKSMKVYKQKVIISSLDISGTKVC